MTLKPFYNEMTGAGGEVRSHYARFHDWLPLTPTEKIAQIRQAADLMFHRVGITFAVLILLQAVFLAFLRVLL